MSRNVAGVRVSFLVKWNLELYEEMLFERNLSEEERAKLKAYGEERYGGGAVVLLEDLTHMELKVIKDHYVAVLDAIAQSSEEGGKR